MGVSQASRLVFRVFALVRAGRLWPRRSLSYPGLLSRYITHAVTVELASADIPALGLPGFAASADANCSPRRKCRKLLLDAKMSECFKNFDTLRGALWTVYDTVGR